jgi:hypothetical protein
MHRHSPVIICLQAQLLLSGNLLPFFLAGCQMRAQLGEPLPLLRAVVRALLSAAAKSLTHIHVLLERYAPLLREVVEAAGQEQGVPALLQLVGAMYVGFPSRLHTALEK